jgi:hypothetical protein
MALRSIEAQRSLFTAATQLDKNAEATNKKARRKCGNTTGAKDPKTQIHIT